MKIALASDHGGFELKKDLFNWLKENNYDVIDLGNKVYDSLDDFPDYAEIISKAIINGEAEKGILICGSGVGAAVAANKFKGIRASVCHDIYSAHQGVEHDAMNIICLGARVVGIQLAKDLIAAFINAKYMNEERLNRRLEKIKKFEDNFGR
jgi:ribose 5-phosphate isomerase B